MPRTGRSPPHAAAPGRMKARLLGGEPLAREGLVGFGGGGVAREGPFPAPGGRSGKNEGGAPGGGAAGPGGPGGIWVGGVGGSYEGKRLSAGDHIVLVALFALDQDIFTPVGIIFFVIAGP